MLDDQATRCEGRPCRRVCGSLIIHTVAKVRRDLSAGTTELGAEILDLSGPDEKDTAGIHVLDVRHILPSREFEVLGSAQETAP